MLPVHVQTLRSMLRYRGYDVAHDQQFENETPVNFAHTVQQGRVQDKVSVVVLPTSKLGIALLRKQEQWMRDEELQHVLLIIQDGVTPQAQQTKKALFQEEGMFIETFTLQDLVFDIMQHAKVPHHYLLSREEEPPADCGKLPKLIWTDPVARYLGVIPHDMVRVVRYTPTGKYTIVRVVVKSSA